MITMLLGWLFAALFALPAGQTPEPVADAPLVVVAPAPAPGPDLPAPAEPTLPADPNSGMGAPAATPGPVGVPPGYSPVETSSRETEGD